MSALLRAAQDNLGAAMSELSRPAPYPADIQRAKASIMLAVTRLDRLAAAIAEVRQEAEDRADCATDASPTECAWMRVYELLQ